MGDKNGLQLSRILKDNSSRTVLRETKKLFKKHYRSFTFRKITRAHRLIKELFEGGFPGYKSCNTSFHNLQHTENTLLAAIRLVDGFNLSGTVLPEPICVNLLLGALLHDSGYIQHESDEEGTGAKYTDVHVERSIEFLRANARLFSISEDEVCSVEKLISSTEYKMDFAMIDFFTEDEKKAGAFLGTADLLGQMSDRCYLEKLLFLYHEYREAGIAGYETEFDILKKTIGFYEFTKERLTNSFEWTFVYAREHFKKRYGIDSNLYIDAIDRHVEYIYRILEDEKTNFRKKLKRAEWINNNNWLEAV